VNIGVVLYVLGRLCMLLSVLLVAPLAMGLYTSGMGSDVTTAFIVTAGISFGLGFALTLSFEMEPDQFGFGEAFATVATVWVVFTGLGAMPFVITGHIPSVVDACFEVLSGFTTTGSSILADPAALPQPLLFWRAMTHWVGGMGIVALSVAILPALGAGGNFLFQAEVPGDESEKLLPRISSTAKLLWGLYLGLTVAQFFALRLAGMTWFDAICHSFATVATGGFGTRADSLTSFGPAIQWIVIGFMFLAGVNFVMLLNVMRGRPRVCLRNTEVRVYAAIVLVVSLVFCFSIHQRDGAPDGLEPLIRDSMFTTVALLTSTADYQLWPVGLHGLILMVMFCGACAGSTGGGAKVIRFIVAAKAGVREVRRLLRPKAVFVCKVGGRTLPEPVVLKTVGFFVLYLMVLVVFTLFLLADGHSGATSFSAIVSCLSNIGPGLDGVGPTQNFAAFGDLTKVALMVCMLLGRLEFYSVLVLLVPLAWKR
jgi:trk system potassium uptake protein TrkH